MPWGPKHYTKAARTYLLPAAALVAIVLALNLAFAHLASPAEKISACAFAVSAMSLFTTLNERKGALRAAVYGKRVDAMAENSRLLDGIYLAATHVNMYAQADGAATDRVLAARQELDAATDAHSAFQGPRILYFEEEVLRASSRFMAEAADFYRAYDAWAKGEQGVQVLRSHKEGLNQRHADYFAAARNALGIQELTVDAYRVIGTGLS